MFDDDVEYARRSRLARIKHCRPEISSASEEPEDEGDAVEEVPDLSVRTKEGPRNYAKFHQHSGTRKSPMTITQARDHARLLYGIKGHVRWDPAAPDAVAKQLLRQELKQASAALAECKRNNQPHITARRCCRQISGLLCSHRASVGFTTTLGGLEFFHVQGEGDTFADAFEQVELQRAGQVVPS